MRSLFIVQIVLLLSFASFAEKLEPIPQSEWCATPASKVQTEASVDCIDCRVTQSQGVSKALTNVAGSLEGLKKESEQERVRREAHTYFVLDGFSEVSPVVKEMLSLANDLNAEKMSGKPLDPTKIAALKELVGDETIYNKIRDSGFLPDGKAMQNVILAAQKKMKTQFIEKLGKMNLTELKQYIETKKKEPSYLKENLLRLQDKFSGKIPCGLTDLETLSILAYTGHLYVELNAVLRENKVDSPEYKLYMPYVKTMRVGLAKLRDYQKVVYRGFSAGAEVADQYTVGKTMTYTAYSSTSRLSSYAEPTKDYLAFEIKSKTGKYIMPFSQGPSEEEVLLQPGANFKVIDKIAKSNSWLIKLEEVVD